MAEKRNSVSKSKDGPRKCQACDIILPDIYAYADHLESKEHSRGLMKKKYGAKYLEAKENMLNQEIEKESDENTSSNDEIEVYSCKLCKKICTGLLSYKLHLSGKKHQKNLKKEKVLRQMQEEKIIPDQYEASARDDPLMNAIFTRNEYVSTEILCKVCNKKCTGPETFKQHNKSESHKKKLAMRNFLIDENKLPSEKPETHEDAPAKCYVCCKEFTGPLPYRQHMQSDSHAKQVRQAGQLSKFKDLYISCGDNNKIQCRECSKCFSGPEPFKNHLKSALHLRLKQKHDLLKTLQGKYPEMITMPLSTGVESGDEEDTAIVCRTCHKAFSGPESARDHFQSQKHGKAAREKRRFEKFKLLKNGNQSDSKSTPKEGSKESYDGDNDSSDEFDVIG